MQAVADLLHCALQIGNAGGRVQIRLQHLPDDVAAYLVNQTHAHALVQAAEDSHDGWLIFRIRIEPWGPATSVGTMKTRESAIELRGTYTCTWSDYSALPGARGRFRLLAVTIGPLQ